MRIKIIYKEAAMKTLAIAGLLLLTFLAAPFAARAEESKKAEACVTASRYIVKPGDCLYKIARKYGLGWKALFAANTGVIKNPNRIYPGQELQIPAAKSVAETKEKAEPKKAGKKASKPRGGQFLYKKSGANPFKATVKNVIAKARKEAKKRGLGAKAAEAFVTERAREAFAKMIGRLSLPEPVKVSLTEQVREAIMGVHKNEVVWDESKLVTVVIKRGDRFNQLTFRDFRVVDNVLVAWPQGETHKAWQFTVEESGKRYYLDLIQACYNLALRVEELPPPPPTAAAPPPPPALKSYSIPPSPPAKKKLLMLLVSPPAIAPPARRMLPELRIGVEENPEVTAELSAGIFHERYGDGNRVYGNWVVGYVYPWNLKDGNKFYSLGVAAEWNGWYGVTGDQFHYDGTRKTLDAALRRRSFNSHMGEETILRLGAGEVNNRGWIEPQPGVRFDSKQESSILTGYLSHEINWQRRWFDKVRLYGTGDLDIGGRRRSEVTVNGNKFDAGSAVETNSNLSFGFNTNVWSSDPENKLALTGGFSVLHYFQTSNTGLRPSLGVDLYNKALETSVYHTSWNKGANSYGIGAAINVSNIVFAVEEWLENRQEIKGNPKQPESSGEKRKK